MTVAMAAAGREAHVDTAAVRGQAAWRAGLGFGWVPQIVQLRRGDRVEMVGVDIMGIREASFIWGNILSLFYFIQPNSVTLESVMHTETGTGTKTKGLVMSHSLQKTISDTCWTFKLLFTSLCT